MVSPKGLGLMTCNNAQVEKPPLYEFVYRGFGYGLGFMLSVGMVSASITAIILGLYWAYHH